MCLCLINSRPPWTSFSSNFFQRLKLSPSSSVQFVMIYYITRFQCMSQCTVQMEGLWLHNIHPWEFVSFTLINIHCPLSLTFYLGQLDTKTADIIVMTHSLF